MVDQTVGKWVAQMESRWADNSAVEMVVKTVAETVD